MKLAEYLKKEKNIPCRIILPDEKNVNLYEKIYYCSDIIEKIPGFLYECNKLEFIGEAYDDFDFDDELIDYMIPRPEIYKEYLRTYCANGKVPLREIETFLDATYYQVWDEIGDQLPIPPIKKGKRIYLYDTKLIRDGIDEVFQEISERSPRTIKTIYPIRVKNFQQFLLVKEELSELSETIDFIFDSSFSLFDLKNEIEKYQEELRAYIGYSTNFFIPFGGLKGVANTEIGYSRDLFRALDVIYTFWSFNIPVKLKYIEPALGKNNTQERLHKYIEKWSINISTKKGRDAAIDRKGISKEIQESCHRISLLMPRSHDFFVQTYNNIKKRGKWK